MKRNAFINRSNLRDFVFIMCIVSCFFYNTNIISISLGTLMLLFGCFLHFITKGVLIRNTVLCRTGIYSVVRHPYYLSNFLIDNSFCLISGNQYLLLFYPFLFFWAYGFTLRKEEKFLGSIYNESYFNYSLEIPQLFPDPKSAKNFSNIFDGFSMQRITLKEYARIIRFLCMFILIIFAHHLKEQFVFSTKFYKSIANIDKILAITIIVLYIFSVVLLKRQKNHKRT